MTKQPISRLLVWAAAASLWGGSAFSQDADDGRPQIAQPPQVELEERTILTTATGHPCGGESVYIGSVRMLSEEWVHVLEKM